MLLRRLSRGLARAEKTVSGRPKKEATRLTVVEAGSTLVVVTHSEALSRRFPRVLNLVDGRFVDVGEAQA